MQLQELFLAWICSNLLNPLVLLLLLNKLPNEISKPPCPTLVWMCDAQGLVCFGFQFMSRAAYPGLFLCALRLFFLLWHLLPLFIGCFILKSHSLCKNLTAHLELGACARCWAKGISCSLGTCSQVPAASQQSQRLQSHNPQPHSPWLLAMTKK